MDPSAKTFDVPLEYTEADLAREGALIASLWPRPAATRQP